MSIATCLFFWLAMLLVTTVIPDRLRKLFSILLPVGFAALLGVENHVLSAPERLLATTLGLLLVVKTVALLRLHNRKEVLSFSPVGLLLYLTIWPGVDATPLQPGRQAGIAESGKRFARGFNFMLIGVALAFTTAAFQPALGNMVGWFGLASLLLMVHFGYADILGSSMRLAGFNVGPVFEEPLKSDSLREFWGKRWNLPFVEMDRLLFLSPLKRLVGTRGAVFCVFIISGLLHDCCISYSAGGGWGLPTLYFLLQAVAVLLEKRFVGKAPTLVRRVWVWAWLLLPLPLLFTVQFREAFIQPLFQTAHSLVVLHSAEWYLSLALWLGALGHFCTLGAGLQVPFRLNWKEELARVSSFNRKIFLNYAGYVGLMIIAFGTGTLLLHDDMLRGERSAIFLTGLISLFWLLRLAVDYVWFGDADWPEGPLFVIGHACLNGLFWCLTITYTAVTLWHTMPSL